MRLGPSRGLATRRPARRSQRASGPPSRRGTRRLRNPNFRSNLFSDYIPVEIDRTVDGVKAKALLAKGTYVTLARITLYKQRLKFTSRITSETRTSPERLDESEHLRSCELSQCSRHTLAQVASFIISDEQLETVARMSDQTSRRAASRKIYRK